MTRYFHDVLEAGYVRDDGFSGDCYRMWYDWVRRLPSVRASIPRAQATAVEVERIAEANRFVAKLLVDRPGPLPAMNKPERVITPH